jgi:uncharacterized membrane protein YjgN (DUF898 family)
MTANVIGLGEERTPPRPTWPSIPSAAPPPLATPVVTGDGAGLARLVARGSLLTILTLGIYRFWYKTDLRRWYWRRTSLAGSALEYRGTARELLIGFLFALAVLAPLYAAAALGVLFAGPIVGAGLQFCSALVFAVLVQYGSYRSRRYRLTRTTWRGLRFDQTGSAWAFAGLSFAWLLPLILSLGLAFPLMRRSLESYRIRHTRFGSAEGRFEVRLWPLMRVWLLLVAPPLLLVGAAIALAATMGVRNGGGGAGAAMGGIAAAMLAILGLAWVFLLWPYYRIREFRLFAEGSAIGPASFRSAARAGAAYAIYAKFFLVSSVAASALGLVAAAVIGAAGGPPQAFAGARAVAVMVVLATLYLVGFLGLGVLKELLLNQPFWRLTAGTLSVTGLDGLDAVLGRAVAEEAATGEGFADALDFGGV